MITSARGAINAQKLQAIKGGESQFTQQHGVGVKVNATCISAKSESPPG